MGRVRKETIGDDPTWWVRTACDRWPVWGERDVGDIEWKRRSKKSLDADVGI